MPSALVATTASSPSRSMMNSAAPVSPSERSRTDSSSPGRTSSVASGSMTQVDHLVLALEAQAEAAVGERLSVRWRRQPSRVAIQPA